MPGGNSFWCVKDGSHKYALGCSSPRRSDKAGTFVFAQPINHLTPRCSLLSPSLGWGAGWLQWWGQGGQRGQWGALAARTGSQLSLGGCLTCPQRGYSPRGWVQPRARQGGRRGAELWAGAGGRGGGPGAGVVAGGMAGLTSQRLQLSPPAALLLSPVWQEKSYNL